MSGRRRSLRRWLQSTSNRTFIVWPVLLLALSAATGKSGVPRVNPWGLPLMCWGYAQYRWVGRLRTARGGGGPGLSNPPERLVIDGPYALVRNPMYLGHLFFLAGLGVLLGRAAWLVFAAHALWFDRRARSDEAHLSTQFGAPYRDYLSGVKRWIPGLY